ncbi:hypothetical protein WQE_22883 [Paraburkholderia hospita]|uniref:Uncharacterized protein n=1 Tax=Paraburkholderia hospita TaxID=169430 RepID=A0ABN0FJ02_9BURK|nr:hypothetical protein [Paraburkholderia hospita]EIM98706.1 hypothetical protein WQE_22883 [Paraburkholderia hospita]
MYQLSFAGQTLILGTLLEVLTVFRTDSRLSSVESSEIVLLHGGQPVDVTRYNGSLTVRRPGSARDVFLSMIDEIDGAYFRPNGVLQAAWQIRRSHWKLLYDAFDLASSPRLIFSSDQIEAAADERGHLALHDLLQAECERRFGFRYAGPQYGCTRDCNGRHEVHVAYALAEGFPVPEAVLAEYRELPEKFSTDMAWGKVLLVVPELRGAMSPDKVRVLASILSREKGGITSQNAALLAMVMRLAPNRPTHVEVDDLLFRHGLVESYGLPERYASPQPLGNPVSKFAEVYRSRMADRRREMEVTRLREERAAGRVSQRHFDQRMQIAQLEHGRETFAFGNEISEAIDSGDVQFMLDLMDCVDERNRVSKQTVREVFGVKLLGVRAGARRRAIFALAGFNEAQQAEWEAAGSPQARELLVRTHHAARVAAAIHPAVYAQSQTAQHV